MAIRDLPEVKAFATDADRWEAVAGRDGAADGRFVYSVRTTGVFCRPTCGARLPKRANVVFHSGPEAAKQAGFRPCRRCRPDGVPLLAEWTGAVARACRTIEQSIEAPGIATLAAGAAMSPSHFQRVFKRVTGLTPTGYIQTVRAARLRGELAGDWSVTDAIYSAGFNSSSGFYAGAAGMLGMTPGSYRAGGAGEMIRFGVGESSLGRVLVAATERGVCSILLGDEPAALIDELRRRFPGAALVAGDGDFETWVAAVVGTVEAPSAGLDLPLDIRGTAFQRLVWQALREIPPGSTASYSEVAERIGRPAAARAVAGACGANHLAVAIPCHRVVHRDGSLSGYRWGVERKKELLKREKGPATGN